MYTKIVYTCQDTYLDMGLGVDLQTDTLLFLIVLFSNCCLAIFLHYVYSFLRFLLVYFYSTHSLQFSSEMGVCK